MERIQGQVADVQKLAHEVLSWIFCAKRPQTTLELQHALAVEIDESMLDEDNLSEIRNMVSACAGLVTVDEESDVIRLVHYTTQEYFRRNQKRWFPKAQIDITMTCVTYLSFDAITGFCPTDEEFEARLQINPLYDYVARNWGHHARIASIDGEQLILDVLESEAKIAGLSQAKMATRYWSGYSGYSLRVPRHVSGVHFAAYFGLSEAMLTLLKKEHKVNSRDSYNQTPLFYAANNGHEAVVRLLLEKGVSLDFVDKYGRTPLSWAADNGHEAVVRLLE